MKAKHLKKEKTRPFVVRINDRLYQMANKVRTETWRFIIEERLKEILGEKRK